jgi:hypothetical protein
MCEKNINIKEIPYGISDFEVIREENYYYVNKTGYIREIEKAGKYLFLSLMDTYYNISKGDPFDRFFKGTSIHQNPTKERNSYLILKFNFSTVSPDILRHLIHLSKKSNQKLFIIIDETVKRLYFEYIKV